MLDTDTIDDWAREHNLELGQAIYVILKYLVVDPRMISPQLRMALLMSVDQEIFDAMDTASDDLENGGSIGVLR